MKLPRNVFGFLENCIWIDYGKFSLIWQQYLPSAVNVLTNSPEISGLTNREISYFNLCQIHEKMGKSAAIQISVVFGSR